MIPDFSVQAEPQRVGMILRRDRPSRLVHRFGYIMRARTASLDPDRYGSVLWDDGEYDLVEWERLRSLSEMNENPKCDPIVSYADEIGDLGLRELCGVARCREPVLPAT